MMQIPVFYDDGVSLPPDRFISLSKPGRLMSIIKQEAECQLLPFMKISEHDLCLVHDNDHVEGVLSGRIANGFGDIDTAITEQVLIANGAFVAAAEHALQNGGVVFAPVSGFHHAGPNRCGGFCTFNALAIAAKRINTLGDRVLILDFDGHFGDGTQEFIDKGIVSNVLTTHLSRSHGFVNARQSVSVALEEIAKNPAVVFYQAGADSHINDSFGAGYFSHDEWVSRDEQIFTACRDAGVPIVWNLAGGYNGKDTILLHYSTWRTAKRVYLRTEPPALKNRPVTASSERGAPD